jgi:hypothetical protein
MAGKDKPEVCQLVVTEVVQKSGQQNATRRIERNSIFLLNVRQRLHFTRNSRG